MMRRYVGLGLAPGLVLALMALGACYDAPQPDCGFRCGPGSTCPTDYSCAPEGHCHLDGTAPTLVCATDDAGVPDAPPDGPDDAAVDAPPDSPVDALPDAPVDAPPDAPPDV